MKLLFILSLFILTALPCQSLMAQEDLDPHEVGARLEEMIAETDNEEVREGYTSIYNDLQSKPLCALQAYKVAYLESPEFSFTLVNPYCFTLRLQIQTARQLDMIFTRMTLVNHGIRMGCLSPIRLFATYNSAYRSCLR